MFYLFLNCYVMKNLKMLCIILEIFKMSKVNILTMLLLTAASFSSCTKESESIQFLAGTNWKLVGMVDTETGVLKELRAMYVYLDTITGLIVEEDRIKTCTRCYTITFTEDSVFREMPFYNYNSQIDIDTGWYKILSGFSRALPIRCEYKIDYKTGAFYTASCSTAMGSEVGELPDGYLFIHALKSLQSFSLQKDELKLYYLPYPHYNINKGYLLFKPFKP